jgi:hypothetical protein
MGGWLIVGAALMYLSPAILDLVMASDQTHLWMANLSRGGATIPDWLWLGEA